MLSNGIIESSMERVQLGHVSLTTTNVYAEVDLEMKAKALASCEVSDA
jgi:integrase/recombinase XerD